MKLSILEVARKCSAHSADLKTALEEGWIPWDPGDKYPLDGEVQSWKFLICPQLPPAGDNRRWIGWMYLPTPESAAIRDMLKIAESHLDSSDESCQSDSLQPE